MVSQGEEASIFRSDSNALLRKSLHDANSLLKYCRSTFSPTAIAPCRQHLPPSAMEVTFDNQSNVLAAQILTLHDKSVIYRVVTDQGLWTRAHTYLKDANPAVGEPTNVGVIHWKDRTFEIYGQKRSLSDIRRRPRNPIKQERYWKWGPDRKEYTIIYYGEQEWQALLAGEVVATFSVPYRPKLFGKLKPLVLNLGPQALEKDEVFLFLVFMYCEAKRQDKTNASGGWQA